MSRLGVLLALALLLAGCGGSSVSGPTSLAGSGTKTTAGPVRFTLAVSGVVAGVGVRADESGTVSFTSRQAHIYKLVTGGGLPQESIINGPFTYANGNVEAAMNDSTVKPWTKLDTRKLTAKQRGGFADELAHVRAPAYLVYGVAKAERIGAEADHTTHFRGTVDPARLARRLPAASRVAIAAAVRSDYADGPFTADFWVDPLGRIRRVHVSYTTPRGGHLVVDAAYSAFGTHVDLRLPPAKDIQDITPS